MREVVIIVGVPGSGKTWVTDQLGDLYDQCLNDAHIGGNYLKALMDESAKTSTKPVLGECPFSMSQIIDPLKAAGRKVTPVFLIENDRVLTQRYFQREQKKPPGERKMIPPGHLTRQGTYAQRAKASGGFMGTSEQVLEHLKALRGT